MDLFFNSSKSSWLAITVLLFGTLYLGYKMKEQEKTLLAYLAYMHGEFEKKIPTTSFIQQQPQQDEEELDPDTRRQERAKRQKIQQAAASKYSGGEEQPKIQQKKGNPKIDDDDDDDWLRGPVITSKGKIAGKQKG
jgi:hypothetical protein